MRVGIEMRKIIKLTISLVIFLAMCSYSYAVKLNSSGSMTLAGKVESKATFRTTDNSRNSAIPLDAGDMVEQRNTLLMELGHDLGTIGNGYQVDYTIQGRTYYDSAWDYGPDSMSDKSERAELGLINTRDDIDDDKFEAEIFLGYLNIAKGPVSLRLGKQALSWGDMSVTRILDGTNPLDMQSPGVPLDERLIPLTMARGTLSLFDVPWFDSVAVDAYYIPGAIEDDNGPDHIMGSPITPPGGRFDANHPFKFKREDIDADRFGISIGGMKNDLGFSLVYYRKYEDNVIKDGASLYSTSTGFVEEEETIDVVGGKFDYYASGIDTVIRGEAAYFFDEAFEVEGVNKRMVMGPTGPAFAEGSVPRFDVIRFGIGLDKEIRIPFLNKQNNFAFNLEWIATKIQDFDRRIITGGIERDMNDKIQQREFTNEIVLFARNTWMNGKVEMMMANIWDVEAKALMIMPTVTYNLPNDHQVELVVRQTFADTYEGVGMLQEDDQVTFTYRWTF